MLKKSLLLSVALMSLNSIQAAQTTQPQHIQNPAHHDPMQHGQKPAVHHDSAHPAKDTKHCPPCPCGGVTGWVLIPAGQNGTPCNQDAAEEKKEEETPHHVPHEHHVTPEHHVPPVHHVTPEHHVTPHKPAPSLHPLPTPEEEALEKELAPIHPHIFRKTDPNHPSAEKKGEWGKALNGKVYFRVLGIWKHDPSVNAETDIIATGVKDKIKMFNEMAQKQHQPQKPTPKPVVKPTETPVAAEAEKTIPDGGNIPPAPSQPSTDPAARGTQPAGKPAGAPKGGWTKDEKGRWVRSSEPDALSTTAWPNLANTTKGGPSEPSKGSWNRAQTGMTGEDEPRIDASANIPQAPSPSPGH